MLSRSYLLLVTCVVAALLGAPVSAGQTWDFAADWSSAVNPNGAWTYGAINGGNTVFTRNPNLIHDAAPSPLDFWYDSAEVNADCAKAVRGAADLAGIIYFADQSGSQISPPASSTTQNPDARWTAPYPCQVSVTATFDGLHYTGSGSDCIALVLHNMNAASPLFNAPVQGYYGGGGHAVIGPNPSQTYTGVVAVNAGDTLDFISARPTGRETWDHIGLTINIQTSVATYTLTGTVTDQATGFPIAGAKVANAGGVPAVTDGSGVYSLTLPEGTYDIQVNAAWYEPQTATGVAVTSAGGAQDIALTRAEVTATSWNYAGDYSITANPAPSADMPVWTYGRWSSDLSTFSLQNDITDSLSAKLWWSGASQFGDYNAKMVSGDYENGSSFAPAGSACMLPGHSNVKSAARWTSPVSSSVWVHAVFRGQGYMPATFADVHVIKNCGTPGAEELLTDIVSGFVGGGTHDPVVDRATVAWWGLVDVTYGDTIDFIVGDGGDGRSGDLVRLDGGVEITEGLATVSGTVYGSDSQPIEGATVQVAGRDEFAVTDVTGYYSLQLPAGSYTITAAMSGVGSDQKEITLAVGDSKTLDFTLGLGTVQGTVKEAESARPIMGAVVRVVGRSESAVTDADGGYSLALGAGDYNLEASAAGRATLTLPVTVTPNQSATVDFSLTLVSSWDFATDFSNVDNPNGTWSYGHLDGSLSVFALNSLPVADGRLFLWANPGVGNPSPGRIYGDAVDYQAITTYFPGDEGFLISPANETHADARWTAPYAARVSVSATFKGLQYTDPGANTEVMILRSGQPTPLLNTTLLGYYGGGGYAAFGANPTATYTGELVVAAGDTIDFAAGDPGRGGSYDRIGFQAAITAVEVFPTFPVTGVVTDSTTGSPLEGVTVSLSPGGGSCTTNATGKYLIYVTAGTYTTEVGVPGAYVPQSAAIEVTSGGAVKDFALARVSVWSLTDDWSYATNPNPSAAWPVWTYGRYDYGFVNFYQHTSVLMGYGGGGLWYLPDNQWSLTVAAIPGEIDTDGTYFPTGTVGFWPALNADRSGVKWTAPFAATIRVNAVWSGLSYDPVTWSELHLAKNAITGSSEFLQYDILQGFAGGGGHASAGLYPVSSWSGLVTVDKGDTIDFSVGIPPGGSRLGSATGLVATIALAGSDVVSAAGLSDLKGLKDGQFVRVTDPKVVTAGTGTFTDGTCYLEDLDRVSGIRVVLAAGLVIDLWQRVTVEGVVGTDANGERTLFVTTITSQASGTPIGPLGAPNRSIKTTVAGASLAGLLVTGWGQIKAKSETGQVIYLDDGSGVVGEPGTTGVKVVLNDTTNPTLVEVGKTVAVKGICALNRAGGVTFPVILARDADDVTFP